MLCASEARAQTDERRAAARMAAMEGVKAFEEGRYQDALDYCTRAESIMHAPTHLLLIARADAKLGRLVEAQEAYFRIERDPLPPDAPAAFIDAHQKAAEEQSALAPRVPTLKVEVQGAAAPDVSVTLDGTPLPPGLIGLAGPINPGTHTLQAKAAGASSEPVTVTVSEGATQSAVLVLRPAAAAPGEGTQAGGTAQPPASADRASQTEAGEGNPAMKWGGWVGVGIGAAGGIAGTIFVIKNHSDRDAANALCGASGCPASKRSDVTSLDQSADRASTFAWISYTVGAAGLATGAVLLWLGGKSAAPSQSAGLHPWIGAHTAGLSVTFQ